MIAVLLATIEPYWLVVADGVVVDDAGRSVAEGDEAAAEAILQGLAWLVKAAL